ncbi:MAG TPA: type IV secretion system DNA-binding domain-containing protein [Rhodocyclaceae bacterium]|nr:type IV secretion system DNA-binding domain-containing protein [Rhodocyclaceae bacterium]
MSNWRNWLSGGTEGREREDTLVLYRELQPLRERAFLADEEARGTFLVDFIIEICCKLDMSPSDRLGSALYDALLQLLYDDGFLINLPDEAALANCTLEEGVLLREMFRRSIRVHKDSERLLAEWRRKLSYLFPGILRSFPASAFIDPDDDGEDEGKVEYVVFPDAAAYDLCDDLGDIIERTLVTLSDEYAFQSGLFTKVRTRFEDNLLRASGIPLSKRHEEKLKLRFPSEQSKMRPEELVEVYLQGTAFQDFFRAPLPFAIPFPARFEHTHIVGGTGHGKTQLLQFLIHHDLVRAKEDGRAVVVIDSQGDLIRTISHLKHCDPEAHGSLADRLVLVDPTDIEHPVSLNMFDFDRGRLEKLAPVDREMTLNAAVETFEFFFGALLGAELTQRQGVIFRYIARLMLEIPDATIHTLRELMENGEKFRPYMERLSGSSRHFFETQFFERQFGETKKQILTRLWGVLSNATIERMFSHTENKVNLFSLLNEGKIVLISTAKDFLGHEGASILGRFFVSLIAQAALQRATMPPHERNPAFVYVDEAQDYFDDSIGRLLNQARKYRIALCLAHQNLDQLDAGLRATVLASTSIKFAGGLSSKDANTLDSEFRVEASFLLAQKKRSEHTEFACYVRNFTNQALSVRIPLGYVDALPTMSDESYAKLLRRSREEYSAPPIELAFDRPQTVLKAKAAKPRVSAQTIEPQEARVAAPEPEELSRDTTPQDLVCPENFVEPIPKPAPRPKIPLEQGGGGRQHKYLQHLIKQLADERGFRTSIEEVILDGAGRVDVSLVRGERRIACEISVTTGRDHELGNVEKCLAAGYTEIVLVGSNERHIKSLTKFIDENLEEHERGKVRYAVPESLIEYLDSLGEPPLPTEQMVRGYKVRTVQQAVDPQEANARRQAIAEVLARSMRKS